MEKNSEEIIYQKLKTAIIKRFVKQGAKLNESALAEQLQVSRTPVHGAIRRLANEGFAIYTPNKGVFVIEPTLEEIKETFFVRLQLEKVAAGLAARNIHPDHLDRLRHYLGEEIRIFENRDLDAYYRINDAIHLLIAETSGNGIMAQYIQELLNRTKIYLILYDPFYSMSINPSIHEHQRLVDALASGDGELAEQAMKLHLESAYQGMEIQAPPEGYISL